MKKQWIFRGATAALAALFLGGTLAVGASSDWYGLEDLLVPQEGEWQYQYTSTWDPEVSQVDGLKIQWGGGPVTVTASDSPLVRVTEYASAPLEESQQLTLSSSGGTLEVAWDGGVLPLGGFLGPEKRLDIQVPREILSQLEELSCWTLTGDVTLGPLAAEELEVTTSLGNINLSGAQGETVRLSAVSGDVLLNGGTAEELFVETNSGAVSVHSMEAKKCHMKSVAGSVFYGEGNAQELTVETVTGRVTTRLDRCPESADLRSVSGDISLGLREDSGFDVAYSSVSGHFHSEFAGTQSEGGLRYGKGGGKLNLTTTWGNMELSRVTGVYAQTAS
ncbi:MAG: DUF4097 family beta strand repeat-containing protein [Acutalibacter sp.]|jgi:hypothetical protein